MAEHGPGAAARNRTPLLRVALTSVILTGAILVAWRFFLGPMFGQGGSEAVRARRLYQECRGAAGGGGVKTLPERVRAAEELAGMKAAEPWVMLMLLDHPALESRASDRGVLGLLIQRIPDDASCPVLWALTTRLGDNETGRFSREEGFIVVAAIDGRTRPIRDITRDALRRALKVDHGYDPEKWRTAIEERGRAARD